MEHLFAAYPGKIVVGGWDPYQVDMWIKLGFTNRPHAEDEQPDSPSDGLVRPPVR